MSVMDEPGTEREEAQRHANSQDGAAAVESDLLAVAGRLDTVLTQSRLDTCALPRLIEYADRAPGAVPLAERSSRRRWRDRVKT